MRIFAIELSSKIGSIALVEDGRVVAERSWQENWKNRRQLFDAMTELAIKWEDVDHFAVGRGPGAFSGLRIAFSVANALAAPGDKPVCALNSGAALAAHYGAAQTVVVGDARRNQLWAGLFAGSELDREFKLLDPAELAGFVPAGALVVSSDHDRLTELLEPFQTLEEAAPVYPTAGKLGELVFRQLEKDIAPEPFEPLYLHPPVFVEPRFPTRD